MLDTNETCGHHVSPSSPSRRNTLSCSLGFCPLFHALTSKIRCASEYMRPVENRNLLFLHMVSPTEPGSNLSRRPTNTNTLPSVSESVGHKSFLDTSRYLKNRVRTVPASNYGAQNSSRCQTTAKISCGTVAPQPTTGHWRTSRRMCCGNRADLSSSTSMAVYCVIVN